MSDTQTHRDPHVQDRGLRQKAALTLSWGPEDDVSPPRPQTRDQNSPQQEGEGGKHWSPRYFHSHLLPFGAWTSGSSPGQASSGSARKREGPGRSAHRRGGRGSTLAGGSDGDGRDDGEKPGRATEAGTAVLWTPDSNFLGWG